MLFRGIRCARGPFYNIHLFCYSLMLFISPSLRLSIHTHKPSTTPLHSLLYFLSHANLLIRFYVRGGGTGDKGRRRPPCVFIFFGNSISRPRRHTLHISEWFPITCSASCCSERCGGDHAELIGDGWMILRVHHVRQGQYPVG